MVVAVAATLLWGSRVGVAVVEAVEEREKDGVVAVAEDSLQTLAQMEPHPSLPPLL